MKASSAYLMKLVFVILISKRMNKMRAPAFFGIEHYICSVDRVIKSVFRKNINRKNHDTFNPLHLFYKCKRSTVQALSSELGYEKVVTSATITVTDVNCFRGALPSVLCNMEPTHGKILFSSGNESHNHICVDETGYGLCNLVVPEQVLKYSVIDRPL